MKIWGKAVIWKESSCNNHCRRIISNYINLYMKLKKAAKGFKANSRRM
jgi:hypothetical protein